MLKDAFQKVLIGKDLTQDEMQAVIGEVMDGNADPIQVAGLLVALRVKGEKAEEIAGAATAMRARMNRLSLNTKPLLDTCGTGGSGTGSFNISTATAFVVAADDRVSVAKHGNKAVSSLSGSADVLSELNVTITAPLASMQSAIETIGIGFLFAPQFHPAMRHAGAIRKSLGIRTIFNLLGPLTNPAGAEHQLMGVFSPELPPIIAEVLGKLGAKRAWVVHGSDGVDELTITGPSHIAEWDGDSVRLMDISPEDAGLKPAGPEAMKGGTPQENAKVMTQLLGGTYDGPLRDAVALNAGAGLLVAGVEPDLKSGVSRALDLIAEGAPLEKVRALAAHTRSSNEG